ncbi:MAG: response regulator [Bacteroidales bacterium]|nr:response regulator [Bacteroidales bacterium]
MMNEPSSPNRLAILIVEDDPHSQLYFTKLLSGLYDTAVAASAREAWDLLHGRVFDLVLMDISLKGDEDGLSLTVVCGRRLPMRICLLLRSRPMHPPMTSEKALEAGCTDYLPKPVSSNDLHRKIAELTL